MALFLDPHDLLPPVEPRARAAFERAYILSAHFRVLQLNLSAGPAPRPKVPSPKPVAGKPMPKLGMARWVAPETGEEVREEAARREGWAEEVEKAWRLLSSVQGLEKLFEREVVRALEETSGDFVEIKEDRKSPSKAQPFRSRFGIDVGWSAELSEAGAVKSLQAEHGAYRQAVRHAEERIKEAEREVARLSRSSAKGDPRRCVEAEEALLRLRAALKALVQHGAAERTEQRLLQAKSARAVERLKVTFPVQAKDLTDLLLARAVTQWLGQDRRLAVGALLRACLPKVFEEEYRGEAARRRSSAAVKGVAKRLAKQGLEHDHDREASPSNERKWGAAVLKDYREMLALLETNP